MHKGTLQWLGVLLGLCGAIAASAQDIGINWHPLDGTAYQSEALPEAHESEVAYRNDALIG